MIHDGIRCNRSRVYGWREGDPTTDVDLHGKPVDDKYFVIVKIKDCECFTSDDGNRVYKPKGIKQAFALGYGGTCYGYGKPQKVTNGTARMIRCGKEMDWLTSYTKTPVYVVQDGHVYVGSIYREHAERKRVRHAV